MLSSRFIAKTSKVLGIFGVAGLLVFQLYNIVRQIDVIRANTSNQVILTESFLTASNNNKDDLDQPSRLPIDSGDIRTPNLEDIRRIVEDNNLHAEIYNEVNFGRVETVSYVIVIQVHHRLHYLRRLIESLEAAPLISWALLIFSHDYFDMDLNKLVQSIKFCRVMQIFYPHSIQLSPLTFPGQHPSDCSSTMTWKEARRKMCQNWRYPDRYGHYRNAQLSQIKHHWWWKANYVFNGISRLKNFDGWVLFFEEDHYVAPDFLYTFDYLVQNVIKLCNVCDVITLGRYDRFIKKVPKLDEYMIMPWFSSFHNMGMAFNRSTWNAVYQCAKTFCQYDDYNWDWSLLHVSMKCMKRRLTTLSVVAPRVFHIGDCGIHHKGKVCDVDAATVAVQKTINDWQPRMFPKVFKPVPMNSTIRKVPKQPRENGGWGDPRDHQLCLGNAIPVVL